MSSKDVSVNWTLEEGPGPILQKTGDPDIIAEHPLAAIYRRHDGSKRCTIDLRIRHGMQATVVSNAKSCEVYGISEDGEQEYQGSAKAELTSGALWKLGIAAKVGLLNSYCSMCFLHLSKRMESSHASHDAPELMLKFLCQGREPVCAASDVWPAPCG